MYVSDAEFKNLWTLTALSEFRNYSYTRPSDIIVVVLKHMKGPWDDVLDLSVQFGLKCASATTPNGRNLRRLTVLSEFCH